MTAQSNGTPNLLEMKRAPGVIFNSEEKPGHFFALPGQRQKATTFKSPAELILAKDGNHQHQWPYLQNTFAHRGPRRYHATLPALGPPHSAPAGRKAPPPNPFRKGLLSTLETRPGIAPPVPTTGPRGLET